MSDETMDAEEQKQCKPCRLCRDNISQAGDRFGIDTMESLDIRRLLQEVYEVKILPTDRNSTIMCMPCYQQLIQHYSFRIKLFARRKTFKLNQSVLVSHIIAFRDTAQQQAGTKPDDDWLVSAKEQSTQTETPESSERNSPITAEPSDNGPIQSEQSKSGVKQTERVNAETDSINTTTTISMAKQLVPLVVDCLKEPLYLKALCPLVVSTNQDDLAPLVLLCSRCCKIFYSKEKLEHHQQSEGCVPCCPICRSEQTVDHKCPKQREYAFFMQHVVGSQKYVNTLAITSATSETIAEEPVASVEREKSIEPKLKLKKTKLDADHNGRYSSSERRSTTPYPLHAENPHSQTDETAPVITLSSSDDEVTMLLIDTHKPVATERSKAKKRKKSHRH
ncbi:uncharacterized protein LOC128296992 [Anopheles moucheti]|uniref:uncharacterized protein LOC128296992 n=1 Tax=Anopheles moucheti TaxID=186751 RepID=UPI0022F02A25|nr:uncharacterized protein LOC128296992 [Anopheles moucheti]